MNKNLKNDTYKNLVDELQSIISKGQYQAYKAVDNIKIQTYLQIGERVVREKLNNKNRVDYEKYLVNNLVIDLNIDKRILYEIIKFYKLYPIVYTVCVQLSWSHFGLLIKIYNSKERQFYKQKTINNSWSVRELRKQIKKPTLPKN